jgi:hypothetical protein
MLGVLLAAFGVGCVVGGFGAGPVSQVRRRAPIVLIGWHINAVLLASIPFFAGAAGHVPLTVSISSTWEQPVIAGLLFIVGVILALGDTMLLTLVQQGIEASLMSRVMCVQFLMGTSPSPSRSPRRAPLLRPSVRALSFWPVASWRSAS